MVVVEHGQKINHRFLINHDPHSKGKQWVTDACFPAAVDAVVDTWGIDEGAASFLTGIVKAIRPMTCLETGTHRGRSTRAIAEALFENNSGHLFTVDMDDYGLMESGALRPHEKEYVTQVIGRTPEVFTSPDLERCVEIDFAFLDGAHDKEGLIADLAFVEERKAPGCIVVVDNADDQGWPEMKAFFEQYSDHPHFCLPTMCGMEIIRL